ncbi:MAG: hypothetical protein P1U86_17350 [Verrucomicrobiales bacterium]|nr:hypothetical protein [Verrucomicrobiales bacterium]
MFRQSKPVNPMRRVRVAYGPIVSELSARLDRGRGAPTITDNRP